MKSHSLNLTIINTMIVLQGIYSLDEKLCICKTCANSLKRKKVPCQAVVNKLFVEDSPFVSKCLNRLELVLISKRILFLKNSNFIQRENAKA